MRIFKPAVFQGNISSRKYFEGWYFKNVSRDAENVYAFIPGISLNRTNPHSFIQILNGVTGESSYIQYPLSSFEFERKEFFVRIGRSTFSSEFIQLDIDTEQGKIKGQVEHLKTVPYPSSMLSPGIMGWYSFVPAMECKHAVVSVNHRLSGILDIYGSAVDFNGGKGYIEKDWGTSFPEAWLWSQCNNFRSEDASLMISVAKIPWLGSFFTGFLGFLYFKGKFFKFNTYNGSAITQASHEGNRIGLKISNRNYSLEVLIDHAFSGKLLAPVFGTMNRVIKESNDSTVYVKLFDHSGNIIFNEQGQRAGFELIEKIFSYLSAENLK